jgi:carbonic anhydrase
MRQLLHGIRIFQHRVFPSCREQFEKLAHGQKPPTLFITCSDSRIVPDLLTQTEPGELFVLRNAGNLVPPYGTNSPSGEAATVEFAVEVLGVRDIVVCGHSDCGAMKGLLKPESLEKLPAVRDWLQFAEKSRATALQGKLPNGEFDKQLLVDTIKANVKVQLEHLRTYPTVKAAEERGDVELHGWFYQFENGEVSQLDEGTGKYVSILDVLTKEVSMV